MVLKGVKRLSRESMRLSMRLVGCCWRAEVVMARTWSVFRAGELICLGQLSSLAQGLGVCFNTERDVLKCVNQRCT